MIRSDHTAADLWRGQQARAEERVAAWGWRTAFVIAAVAAVACAATAVYLAVDRDRLYDEYDSLQVDLLSARGHVQYLKAEDIRRMERHLVAREN